MKSIDAKSVRRSSFNIRRSQPFFWGSIWVGVVLIVAGLATQIITGIWSNIAVALIVVGLLLLAIALLLRWRFGPPSQAKMSWWRRRSAQSTTNALIATAAVVLILAVFNVMAVRYGQQFDFTESRLFSLAPQTQETLRSLPQPLKVWSFTKDPIPQERTLLEEFRQVNPERFQFEFVDPQLQPGLAQKFKVFSTQKAVLEYGDRTKTIDSPFVEADITPAMAALVNNQSVTVYFTEGHGEIPLTGGDINLQSASSALSQKDISVISLNLIQKAQIPTDANVLVIAGPKRSFTDPEVQLISAYLNQGGHLLALLDPEFKTGLEELLAKWGVVPDNRLIVDASGSGQLLGLGFAVPLVVQYGQHPITQDFTKEFSYYPLAQAFKLIDKADLKLTPLLYSQERTWAEAEPDSEELEFDPKVDLQGPLVLGVAVEGKISARQDQAQSKPTAATSQKESPDSRLVIIGDSDFATSGPFDQGINGDVFLNSISWLSSDNSQLSIRPKKQVERRLDIPKMRFRFIALLAIVFLPLTALIIGSTIWWKRR